MFLGQSNEFLRGAKRHKIGRLARGRLAWAVVDFARSRLLSDIHDARTGALANRAGGPRTADHCCLDLARVAVACQTKNRNTFAITDMGLGASARRPIRPGGVAKSGHLVSGGRIRNPRTGGMRAVAGGVGCSADIGFSDRVSDFFGAGARLDG